MSRSPREFSVPLPMPMAKVMLSLAASSAYFRNVSQVQLSCRAFFSSFAGYIAWMSRPCLLNQLMRAQGGFVCVPLLVGTADQCPLMWAR